MNAPIIAGSVAEGEAVRARSIAMQTTEAGRDFWRNAGIFVFPNELPTAGLRSLNPTWDIPDPDPEPPPKDESIRRYSQAEIDAILEYYDLDDDDPPRSLILVELTDRHPETGKIGKAVKPHWGHLNPTPSKWANLPPITRDRLLSHISKPNCIVGVVPFRAGLMIADVDISDIDALGAVTSALGAPLCAYRTGSGGWHAIYAIDGLNTATGIPASGYTIDGVHFGELCCLHRFANIWDPISWVEAVKKRISGKKDFPIIDKPTLDEKIGWMEKARKKRPPATDTQKTKDADIREFVGHYRMEWNGKEYQGHCPECDKGSGGGTRFKANEENGRILFNCFVCAPNGFDDDAYKRIMGALRK